MIEVAEEKRRVDERRRFRERRHVGRRNDAVVDRDALVHVREVVLFEAQLAVLVQHEIDRLAVILFHQLLEPHQRLVESVVVVELNGAVERDRLLGVRSQRDRGDADCDEAQ